MPALSIVDVVNFTKDEAARVNEVVASAGLTISGLGYYPNPLAPDKEEAQIYIDHIKQVILAAELLGVGVIKYLCWPRLGQICG